MPPPTKPSDNIVARMLEAHLFGMGMTEAQIRTQGELWYQKMAEKFLAVLMDDTACADGKLLVWRDAAGVMGFEVGGFAPPIHTHVGTDITSQVADSAHADSADYATAAGDADTVDGMDAADFATVVHTHLGGDVTSQVADAAHADAATVAEDTTALALVAAQEVDGVDSALAVAAFPLDPSECPVPAQYRVRAALSAVGVSAVVTLTVQLYNLSDAEFVTDSLLTCTNEANATTHTSAWMVPAAAAGEIQPGLKVYEVRIILTVGGDLNDIGTVGSVVLERKYV